MSLDDKFDKIIREKIEEAEFPFDQSNWEKASRMIDADRAAAAGGKSSKMFLVLGSLFLVSASVFFFSISMSNSESGKLLAVKDEVKAEGKVEAEMEVEAKVENTSEFSGVSTTGLNGESEGKAEMNTNRMSGGNTAAAANASDRDALSKTGYENNNYTNEIDNGSVNNGGDLSDGDGASAGKNMPVAAAAKKEKGAGKHQKLPVPGEKKQQVKSGRKPVEKRNESEILNAAKSQEAETAENMTMTSNLLQIWNKEEALKATAYDFIRIYDEDYFVKKKRRTHYMNGEAGMAYHFGWKTADGRDAAGFNWFAGINYGRYISKKSTASISAGLQVYNVSNIHKPFYSQCSYRYDFGSNGSFTEITANELYYVSVPIRLSIPVSKTGKAGFGVNTGMLFSGASTVTNYTLRDGIRGNESSTRTKGYYDGVNPVQVMASAFYNHRISRRMSVNGEIFIGLTDVYRNNVTNAAYAETNKGVRISLQYNIFDR